MRIIRSHWRSDRVEHLIEEDPYVHLPADAPVPTSGDIVIPWERWTGARAEVMTRAGRTGVRVAANIRADILALDLASLPLIAIEFPSFTDGRGYSLARRLREQFGYTGELRAVGNVLRDQLAYMARCGFSAFEVDPDQGPLSAALGAFAEQSVRYQPAADEPLPLWKRVDRRGL